MAAYFRVFNLVEVQSTFYRLPRIETVRRWREKSPKGFEYTLKAWQAITHPLSSPTWRRAGKRPPVRKADRYGYFRPSDENFQAWKRTKEICEALGAKICVLQSPASFRPTDENCKNISTFMQSIERQGLEIAWEPRGQWRNHEELVRSLCNKLDLIHVVDIFRWTSLSDSTTGYIRLHGIGKGEVNYKYRYSDKDLRKLLRLVRKLEEIKERVYVLFNNISMAEDARRFVELAKSQTQSNSHLLTIFIEYMRKDM